MVNPPKVTDLDYVNFILASQRIFTCMEAARSQSADEGDDGPSHDAFTRLLQRMPKDVPLAFVPAYFLDLTYFQNSLHRA